MTNVSDGSENILGRGEHSVYSTVYPEAYLKGYFIRIIKRRDCVQRLNNWALP